MATALEALLECPVCVGRLAVPVTIGCGHTYCRECILSIPPLPGGGVLTCPLCRAPHTLEAVRAVAPSRALQGVLELLSAAPA